MLKDRACLRLYLLSCGGGSNFPSLWPLSLKILSKVRLQVFAISLAPTRADIPFRVDDSHCPFLNAL